MGVYCCHLQEAAQEVSLEAEVSSEASPEPTRLPASCLTDPPKPARFPVEGSVACATGCEEWGNCYVPLGCVPFPNYEIAGWC
jgi:hypothetical protein